MKSINEPIKVAESEISTIIQEFKPIGLFYAEYENGFIAVDNKTGDAWTENFRTKKKAIKWLTKYN